MVVDQEKGLEVLIQFGRGLVMEALDGGFFDSAVHASDMAVARDGPPLSGDAPSCTCGRRGQNGSRRGATGVYGA